MKMHHFCVSTSKGVGIHNKSIFFLLLVNIPRVFVSMSLSGHLDDLSTGSPVNKGIVFHHGNVAVWSSRAVVPTLLCLKSHF